MNREEAYIYLGIKNLIRGKMATLDEVTFGIYQRMKEANVQGTMLSYAQELAKKILQTPTAPRAEVEQPVQRERARHNVVPQSLPVRMEADRSITERPVTPQVRPATRTVHSTDGVRVRTDL